MKSMFMALILLAIVANGSLFAIESTGNQTLDDFFTNVEKINTGIDTVKEKINRTNAYIIWALNDPNDFNANIATQSYAEASAAAAKKYATQPSITLNTASFKTVLTPDNLIIFMSHVTAAQKELTDIRNDVDDISKNALALINNAKALPAEAKKLSPMKVPKIIGNIGTAVKQLQASLLGVKAIIQTTPVTLQLMTAIIGGQSTDIQITMFTEKPAGNAKEAKQTPQAKADKPPAEEKADGGSSRAILPTVVSVLAWACLCAVAIVMTML